MTYFYSILLVDLFSCCILCLSFLSVVGNVYIADSSNNRIRKVTVSTGIISTIAGTGSASFSGDGGAATSAELSYPRGVALDSSGRIWHNSILFCRIP